MSRHPPRSARRWFGLEALTSWPRRRWLVALFGTAGAATLIGVPTALVRTGLFTRMTPATWWDYPVWALSAVLVGLTAATFVKIPRAPETDANDSGRTLSAALLSALAVGCPVCNKLVVALIGISGALNTWAPIQPLLGVLSLGLLATGLVVRLRGEVSCRVLRAR